MTGTLEKKQDRSEEMQIWGCVSFNTCMEGKPWKTCIRNTRRTTFCTRSSHPQWNRRIVLVTGKGGKLPLRPRPTISYRQYVRPLAQVLRRSRCRKRCQCLRGAKPETVWRAPWRNNLSKTVSYALTPRLSRTLDDDPLLG